MLEVPFLKYLLGVRQLIYLADINFLVCASIYNQLSLKNYDKDSQFFLLTANNAFHESVEVLHTLLCSKKDEELRIEPVLKEVIQQKQDNNYTVQKEKIDKYIGYLTKDYPKQDIFTYTFLLENDNRLIGDIAAEVRSAKTVADGLDDLNKLKQKFEGEKFHLIRHHTSAHKSKYLELPAGSAIAFLRSDLISNLAGIIKQLRINAHVWFDCSLVNPHENILESLYKLSV